MKQLKPAPAFATSQLEIEKIGVGRRFGRLYLKRYPESLGYGKTPSRFSDPRRRIADNRFGVLYLGESLKVCFLEAVLRDLRNGEIGEFQLSENELHIRNYVDVEIASELKLVDLRGDAAIRMGVPSDVARASRQSLGRAWSVAFHEHPSKPDGIIYQSRLNDETNLAIYDRGIPKLAVRRVTALINAEGLAAVLNDLKVALVI
jgi:hypothetical protein